jgi:uncharacterized protein (DUF58 family)
MTHQGVAALDPQVLSGIADLEFVARVTVEGTVSGLHRSPFHGYSAEFSQYRQYRPGDDLKYVDWKLLARTDRVYTKQFRETTNMVAELALDASASMRFAGREGVSKGTYAKLLAAAMAHLVSRQGDAVGLVTYDDRVKRFVPPRTGQTHLRRVLTELAKLECSGATATAAALRRSIDLLKRRGVLILVSDLYDEDETVESELRRAARIGHEVAVFHVLTREELELPYGGDVQFQDLESGRSMLANVPAARAAYRERMESFVERWRTRCLTYGIDYVPVLTHMPLDAALRGYLLKRAGAAAR